MNRESDSADDALLALVHVLLRERWRSVEETQGRAEEAAYEASAATAVRVRGLRVQQTLFVHFVSASKSLRLDLKLCEYVRAAGSTAHDADDRVARVGSWLCSLELLRWRLERSVFPEFEAPTPATTMQAELGKLAPSVLTRLFAFLHGSEFVRATQTNKYLHGLADSAALWQQFLKHDYPDSARSRNSALDYKAAYAAQHQRQREQARRHSRQNPLLPPWTRDHDDVGLWFHPPPPGLWTPPAPLQPRFPGRDPRWDLDSDADVQLPFDRRHLH